MDTGYKRRFNEIISIRGLLPNSCQTYNGILDKFLYFCKQNNCLPEQLEHFDLVGYIAQQKSDSMKRQAIGMLKTLYEFVLNQGYKCLTFPYPKKRHLLPDYFTPQEMNLIFNSIKNIKQRTIIKVQYALALRVHEVCKIKRSDFIKKFDHHSQKFVYDLRIIGKGYKMREIPVPDETISLIFEYWKTVMNKKNEYLFHGQFRESYSTKSVQIVLKRTMAALGIKKYGSTHLLRKSRITHLIQNGCDISFIQILAGHSNINTLKPYLALKTADMRVAFSRADEFMNQQFNPQKQLKAS